MTWLPTDHCLGVHHIDELGQIDRDRPMADIDVVSLALSGGYTLIGTADSHRHGIVPGLRISPLVSKLAMDLASVRPGGVAALGFRRGDMSWVSLQAGHAQRYGTRDSDARTSRGLACHELAGRRAGPDEQLRACARGAAGGGSCSPTGCRHVESRPTKHLGPQPSQLAQDRFRQLGDLTWAVPYVTPPNADAADPEDDARSRPELPRRRAPDVPWWELGAWLLSRRPPRL